MGKTLKERLERLQDKIYGCWYEEPEEVENRELKEIPEYENKHNNKTKKNYDLK